MTTRERFEAVMGECCDMFPECFHFEVWQAATQAERKRCAGKVQSAIYCAIDETESADVSWLGFALRGIREVE